MAMPVIPGVVRATVRGTLPSGTQWANVVHFRYAGGASNPGTTEIDNLHPILTRLWAGTAYASGAAWLTFSKTTVVALDVTYYVLNGTATPYLKAFAAAGSLSTNLEPAEVAHCLTVRTATRGRSFRGRVYLPPVVVPQLDANGNLISSASTSIIAQWTGMQAAAVAAQWSMGVASYLRHVFTDATGVTMDLRPDVIRRRKR